MTGDINDLIQYRTRRYLETLREAKAMIDNGFWNASVNRVYYLCYYAVSALLLFKSIETSSHKGIRQMFGLHFVQTGLVSKDDGRFFSDLYDRRQTGDYDDFINYDEGSGERFYSMSNQILAERKRYYEILQKVQHCSGNITEWLDWFLNCLKNVMLATENTTKKIVLKAGFWKLHEHTPIKERQSLILLFSCIFFNFIRL